jgi:DNA-3-methyladenine glycosylase I
MSDAPTNRCFWCGDDALYIVYHDTEWGVPVHDDRELFERLMLEGFQAGLSWRTILYKRENFRAAFDGFKPATIAAYDEAKIAALLQDAGIVRNRLKVRGAVQNAQAYLRLVEEHGSFSDWLWQFVGQQPILPATPLTLETIPNSASEAKTDNKNDRGSIIGGFADRPASPVRIPRPRFQAHPAAMSAMCGGGANPQ